MRKTAQAVLKMLKEEHPLPTNINLEMRCYDRPTLTARNTLQGSCTALGYVERRPQGADICIAIKQPMAQVVDTVLHEYYHCLQKYVLNIDDNHPDLEPQARQFAANFTFRYIRLLNQRRTALQMRKVCCRQIA